MIEPFLRQRLKESIKKVIDEDFCLTRSIVRRGVTHRYIATKLNMVLNNRLHKMIIEAMELKGARRITRRGNQYYKNIGVLNA